MMDYVFTAALTLIQNRVFRNDVLRTLASLYASAASPDYFRMAQCYVFLKDSAPVADALARLVSTGQVGGPRTLYAWQAPAPAHYGPTPAPLSIVQTALAFQLAFELYDSATQEFLSQVRARLLEAASEETKETLTKVSTVLAGDITLALHVEFLSRTNHADRQILTNTKEAVGRDTLAHSATVIANALM